MSRIAIGMAGGMQSLTGGIDPLSLEGSSNWIPAIGGYVLFFDGDRGVWSNTGATTPATNGGAVQAWSDQSGNGHNVSIGATSAQRNYVTNALNGHSVIGGDGTVGGFSSTFVLAQPITVFQVNKYTWVNGNTWHTSPAGSPILLCQSATPGNFRLFGSSGVGISPAGYVNSAWQIWVTVWNGASSFMQINGQAATAANTGASAAFTGFEFLDSWAGGANNQMAALLVYPSALSAGNITAQINDINLRFAIF